MSCFWRLQAAIPFADPSRGQGSLRSFRFFFLPVFLFSFWPLAGGALPLPPLFFFFSSLCFGLQRASCCSPYRTIRAVHDSTSLCSLCSLLVMSFRVAGSRRLRWAAVWSLGSFPPTPPFHRRVYQSTCWTCLCYRHVSSCLRLLLLFIIVRDIYSVRAKVSNNNNNRDHDIKDRRRGT